MASVDIRWHSVPPSCMTPLAGEGTIRIVFSPANWKRRLNAKESIWRSRHSCITESSRAARVHQAPVFRVPVSRFRTASRRCSQCRTVQLFTAIMLSPRFFPSSNIIIRSSLGDSTSRIEFDPIRIQITSVFIIQSKIISDHGHSDDDDDDDDDNDHVKRKHCLKNAF